MKRIDEHDYYPIYQEKSQLIKKNYGILPEKMSEEATQKVNFVSQEVFEAVNNIIDFNILKDTVKKVRSLNKETEKIAQAFEAAVKGSESSEEEVEKIINRFAETIGNYGVVEYLKIALNASKTPNGKEIFKEELQQGPEGVFIRMAADTIEMVDGGLYPINLEIVKFMQQNTKLWIFDDLQKIELPPNPNYPTTISVFEHDSLSVALVLKDNHMKPALLNMTNNRYPGGRWKEGSYRTLEDQIYLRSTYFAATDISRNKHLYNQMNGTYRLPTFSALFSPKVQIFRDSAEEDYAGLDNPELPDNDNEYIDIISAAAYNLASQTNPSVPKKDSPEYINGTKAKIRTILLTAIVEGNDSIVLGAFGCGSFQNPPEVVAQLFKEVLNEEMFQGRFKTVAFAVLGNNFSIFKDILAPNSPKVIELTHRDYYKDKDSNILIPKNPLPVNLQNNLSYNPLPIPTTSPKFPKNFYNSILTKPLQQISSDELLTNFRTWWVDDKSFSYVGKTPDLKLIESAIDKIRIEGEKESARLKEEAMTLFHKVSEKFPNFNEDELNGLLAKYKEKIDQLEYTWSATEYLKFIFTISFDPRYKILYNKEIEEGPKFILRKIAEETEKIIKEDTTLINREKMQDMKVNTQVLTYEYLLQTYNIIKINNLFSLFRTTTINIYNADTFECAALLKEKNLNPLVLSMANPTFAGGGFKHGAFAQEEELWRRSTLIQSLSPSYNKQLKDKMGGKYGIPEKGGVYSPNVQVFRESSEYRLEIKNTYFDIISVAAYNLASAKKETIPVGDAYDEGMKVKIRVILLSAITMRHDSLVLGALGCGGFKNNANKVAKFFKEVLEEDQFKGMFKEVAFAILAEGNVGEKNLEAFRITFGVEPILI